MNAQLISYGLLVRIAQLSTTQDFVLGKTKVQKLIFLLSELCEVQTGYSFRFYTYGPYSSELAGDIDYLSRIGVLQIKDNIESEGYSVSMGDQAKKVQDMVAVPMESMDENIKKIINEFGKCSAKELELIATLIYISKYDPNFSGEVKTLVEKVKELKPKFLDREIEIKVANLAKKKFLNMLAVAA